MSYEMKRNQFYNVNGTVMKVAIKTKRKPALIEIAIPDELAEKLIQQYCVSSSDTIVGLLLSWHDKSIEVTE